MPPPVPTEALPPVPVEPPLAGAPLTEGVPPADPAWAPPEAPLPLAAMELPMELLPALPVVPPSAVAPQYPRLLQDRPGQHPWMLPEQSWLSPMQRAMACPPLPLPFVAPPTTAFPAPTPPPTELTPPRETPPSPEEVVPTTPPRSESDESPLEFVSEQAMSSAISTANAKKDVRPMIVMWLLAT